MLSITNLTYRIGGRTILENSSVNVMDGWKVGVVGANGTGKTTLFKLIAGELHVDGGEIHMTEKHRFGMVRQDIPDTDTPILDIVLQADEELAGLDLSGTADVAAKAGPNGAAVSGGADVLAGVHVYQLTDT